MVVKLFVLPLIATLLVGCGGPADTPVSAPPPTSPSSSEPSSPPASTDVAGRAESLGCDKGDRLAGLAVAQAAGAPGFRTPEEAAHALTDEHNFPRSQYSERQTTGSVGQPVLEFVDQDGRVVAFVSVGRTADGGYRASGLSGCTSAFGG